MIVIPAQAGIQFRPLHCEAEVELDPRLRGGDDSGLGVVW
jgi:hypothetical protein